VRFGMQLPVQSQSTYYVEPWETPAGRDELAAIARTCDDVGFDYIAVCDHVAIPSDRAEAMSTVWYDTVATLGWLAAVTTRTRLLSHVWVAPYRHPLVTAKAFGTIDELSGGRVILGVGAGHLEAEFDALGVPFAERGRLTDEAIDGVRAAWSDEFGWHRSASGIGSGTGTGTGSAFGQRPRPVQAGGPPIWVGGSSPPALRRAALRGDGWLPQATKKDEMPEAIARISELRAAAGRDGEFTVGAILRPFYVGDPGWDTGRATLAGDVDRIRKEIADYEAMGVDQVQVRFRSRSCEEYIEQIQRFAKEVM
jgi:probable F420-dependent oxidoreductase